MNALNKTITGFTAASVIAGPAFFLFADDRRKESVKDWLVPDKNLIQVFAPEANAITAFTVEDDEQVARDQAILVLSTEPESDIVGKTQKESVRWRISLRMPPSTEHKPPEAILWHRMTSYKCGLLAFDRRQQVEGKRLSQMSLLLGLGRNQNQAVQDWCAFRLERINLPVNIGIELLKIERGPIVNNLEVLEDPTNHQGCLGPRLGA